MNSDKEHVQKHWNSNPCGSRTSDMPVGTAEYFKQIDDYRFGYYAPWLPRVMGFADAAGKQVLEIGVGHGTDLAMFAKNGALCTAADITDRHLELAEQRFQLAGLEGRFVKGDAEQLPFADNTFDIVYSYGVIHHTPDIHAAIREIHRVLKPGGEARIMIYARYSEFNLYIWLQGLARLEFFRYGYKSTISHWCEGTTWDNPVIVGRYSASKARQMFLKAGFSPVRISKHLLTAGNIPVIGKHLSEQALARIARLIGWNLIIKARK